MIIYKNTVQFNFRYSALQRHSPAEFIVAPNDRVQLPLLGHVGKVPGVLCQSCLDLRDELLLVSPPTIINGVKIVDNIS